MSRSEKTSQFGKYSNLIITALLLVPLLYTSNELRGRNNQLHIASYPESWNKLKSEFSTTPVDCEIKPCHTLVTLPWHSYMDFGFAQRVISNPLPVFIGKDIVWGPENVEFGNLIYSQNELSGNIVDEFIGGGKGFWWINQHMQDSTDLIERTFLREKTRQRIAQLKKHGVSHLVIVFESDYKSLDGLVDYLILNGFAQSQDIQNEYELLVIK